MQRFSIFRRLACHKRWLRQLAAPWCLPSYCVTHGALRVHCDARKQDMLLPCHNRPYGIAMYCRHSCVSVQWKPSTHDGVSFCMQQYGGWSVSLSSLNNAAAGLRPPVHVLSWPDALCFCYALRQVVLGRWLADFPSLGCWLQVLLFSGGPCTRGPWRGCHNRWPHPPVASNWIYLRIEPPVAWSSPSGDCSTPIKA